MKRIIVAATAALALLCGSLPANAFDPKEILSGLAGGNSGSEESESSPLGAIGDFINNTLASNKFSIDDLTGTWTYVSPAVSFQSGNALKKIGGAAAATALEDKLEPYYKRLGFNRTSLVVDADHNFTLKLGLVTLKGVVEKTDDDRLQFNLNAFNRISLGKLTANATKSGNTLNLTFDASKLIDVLSKISGVLNNSTLTTLSDLLNSYEGVYMGFKLNGKK